ncbi:MAG: hypothetical protein HYU86_07720 [Chloroflexi bacterium]|nr:hypothetical protein [Chloroflexota bacterium]
MPITRKQFELGIDSAIEEWMKRIHRFLADHKDEAFTEEEIKLNILGQPPERDTPEWIKTLLKYQEKQVGFSEALGKLVELSAAKEKSVGGATYYAVGSRPLEL